jgi:hypothetical protein
VILKAGLRLRSVVCDTQVIVVKAPAGEVDLACGGAAMVPIDGSDAATAGEPDAAWSEGTLLGKRYANDDAGIELLCSRGGTGSLSLDGVAIPMKSAQPLPASD